MKLSLQLPPDKQVGKTEAEIAAMKQRFHEMTAAYEILGDMATRRQYDRERDKLDANNDAGLIDAGKMDKPPPTCVDVDFTLDEVRSALNTGSTRQAVGSPRREAGARSRLRAAAEQPRSGQIARWWSQAAAAPRATPPSINSSRRNPPGGSPSHRLHS